MRTVLGFCADPVIAINVTGEAFENWGCWRNSRVMMSASPAALAYVTVNILLFTK